MPWRTRPVCVTGLPGCVQMNVKAAELLADNAVEKAEKGSSVRGEFEHRAQRRRQLHDADQRGDFDNFR